MRAGELLACARDLVDRSDEVTAGLWSRAAAFLARQALETAIADLWRAKIPAVAACSMRAQLLALSTAADRPTARRARHVYTTLSRACHHRAYELSPTADELRGWIDEIEHVIAVCAAAAGAASAPRYEATERP